MRADGRWRVGILDRWIPHPGPKAWWEAGVIWGPDPKDRAVLRFDPQAIVELAPPAGPPGRDAEEIGAPQPGTHTTPAPWLPVWVAADGGWHLARLLAWHQPSDGSSWTVTVRASLDGSAPVRHLVFDPATIEPVRNQPPQ